MRIDSYNHYHTLPSSVDKNRKQLVRQDEMKKTANGEESRTGKNAGETAGKNAGEVTEKNAGEVTEKDAGKIIEKNAGKVIEKNAGEGAGEAVGKAAGQEALPEENALTGNAAAAGRQEIKDEVILSEEARSRSMSESSKSSSSQALGTGPPSDDSGQLTRRLVMATTQAEVIEIRSKALGSMASLRIIVGLGSKEDAGKAKSIIRKLERLVQRSRRKIRDLNKEDNLKLEENRAVREEKKVLAEKIEKELRRREIERKAREQSYLNEIEEETFGMAVGKLKVNSRLSSSEEARIERAAEVQAAVEISISGAGSAVSMDASGAAEESAGTEVSGDMGSSMDASGFTGSVNICV